MNLRKQIGATVLAVALAVAGLLASFVLTGSASANNTMNVENTSQQIVQIGKASFSGEAFASGQVTVLMDMNLRAGVKINRKNCRWTKRGEVWWSGGWGMHGKEFEMETVPGLLCRSKKSKTGWVKVAGGKTGRKCFNEARVSIKPPGKIAQGKIIWVSSSANVVMHLKAFEKFVITAVCGRAEGEASASISVSLRMVMRSRGSVVSKFFANVKGDAWVRANGKLECVPVTIPAPPPTTTVVVTTPGPPSTTTIVTTTTTTTTTTQPPPTTTAPPPNRPPTVEIPGPQHVYVGGTVSYCVTASDPDGDALSYMFSTSYGSISSSGNCYLYQAPSQPGSATITVIVSDGKGGRASATTPAFEVVADDFGG